ncbi:MAG: 4-(cytidine 5'-diphospho)-2-C-methyl-D-erythritol kinase [Candidatus Limnocylindrales bacterium]
MSGLVVRLAPAKLNLTLAVIGRRADGFHDLHSVFVPLALADRLSLAVGGRADTLHVDGADTGPVEDNLVLRGIAAARAVVGEGPGRPVTSPLAARLEKRIPVAAGLGGGSSDGAAALDGALHAWGAHDLVDADRRLVAAANLGSDVPFFLAGGAALVEGRGERVQPLRGLTGGEAGVVLITPRLAVRTPDVYALFAGAAAAVGGAGDPSIRQSSEHLAQELRTGLDAAGLIARAGVLAAANDLRRIADFMVPELIPFRRALMRVTGRPIAMTGSGPTCFALYASMAEAERAATTIRDAVADGTIPSPGAEQPSIIVTTIPATPGEVVP